MSKNAWLNDHKIREACIIMAKIVYSMVKAPVKTGSKAVQEVDWTLKIYKVSVMETTLGQNLEKKFFVYF